MKKITLILLLIQSGFMMAQTETVVTPNGKKITVYTNAVNTVDNGLTKTDGNAQLGGLLTKPTTITTTPTNNLAIKDLQPGTLTDQLVTTDANGVLRKVAINNWWTTSGNTGTNASTNFIGTIDNQDLVFKRNNSRAGLISMYNTSFGYNTLPATSTGSINVVFGSYALSKNTIGGNNTAIGFGALQSNTEGEKNTAIGTSAMSNNKTGNRNVAVGEVALDKIESGEENISIGFNSGRATSDTNPVGELKSSNNSIFIGAFSSASLNNSKNEIVIGYAARGRGSNTVTIGNNAITSIGGYVAWSNYSDSRLKKNIVSSTYGLDFITKLRPVLYNMKTGTTELQSGFIAQEVEAAANSIGYKFSGVVKPQSDNDFYALSYASFVVPLVKAVQEQQKQIEDLQKQIQEKDAKNAEFENRLLKLEQKLK